MRFIAKDEAAKAQRTARKIEHRTPNSRPSAPTFSLAEKNRRSAESTAFFLFVYQLFSITFAQLVKKSKSYKANGTF
jgi:hypothetical protein